VFAFARLLPMSDVDKAVEILAQRAISSPSSSARSTDPASPGPTGHSSPPSCTDYPVQCCGNCT
jgi:hypothetical protein